MEVIKKWVLALGVFWVCTASAQPQNINALQMEQLIAQTTTPIVALISNPTNEVLRALISFARSGRSLTVFCTNASSCNALRNERLTLLQSAPGIGGGLLMNANFTISGGVIERNNTPGVLINNPEISNYIFVNMTNALRRGARTLR